VSARLAGPSPPRDIRDGAWDRGLVLLLALLALGLRAWGNGYGFPQPWARPDELRWVRIALGILEDPDPRWFEWPTLHAYLQAAVYWVWGHVRLALGHYPSWHAFLNEDPDLYPADLVLIGRWLSALIGALTIPVTWRLGERLGPARAGLWAALFMAVSFGPVRDAHWALIEALLLLGIVATLLLVVRALERPTLGRFALAGIAAGVTASAKYSGVTLAVPIALAVLRARKAEGRSALGTLWDRRLLLAAALVVVAFFAGSPFILVSRKQFMDAMFIRSWSYRDASFGTAIGFVHHLVFSLRYSHGLLMEVVGIVGLLTLGFKSAGRMTIVAYTLATYLAMGPARIIPMRYASSLAPGIVLGAAWALMALADRVPRHRLALGVAAVLLVADPLYRDVRLDRLLSREDTRVTARRWLDAHVAPPGPILARDSKALRWGRPALEDRYEVVAYGNRLARRRAAPWALLAESPTGYIPWAPEIHAVLREVGTVAVVFDPYAPNARPVYDPHDAFFVPVAGFEGVSVPGPRITIYRLGEASP
jgi:dolichyl-phosphate-mannose-protein mannosyltransferase